MNATLNEPRNLYGSFVASDNAKVIAGDYTSCIQITSSTVNISCPCMIGTTRDSRQTAEQHRIAWPTTASQMTSNSNGDTTMRAEPATYRKHEILNTSRRTADQPGDSLRVSTTHTSLQPLIDTTKVSVSFKDNLKKPCAFASKDRQYRIFFLSKIGPDWSQSTCAESFMSVSEINERIQRGPAKSRLRRQNVERTLRNLEPSRRSIAKCLLDEINGDPSHSQWSIVAVDNEDARRANKTGHISVFSVILARQ